MRLIDDKELLYFSSFYKDQATFKTEDGKGVVTIIIEYRDEFGPTTTLGEWKYNDKYVNEEYVNGE